MTEIEWGARAPYRVLTVASPPMRGEDVRAVQVGSNDRDRGNPARGIGQIEADGEYGPITEAALRRASYALGTLASTQAKAGTTIGEQVYIRAPAARPPEAVERGKARVDGGGAGQAIRAARGKVGVRESPAGSNRGGAGGFVTAIQVDMLGWAGWPWCGAFVGWACKQGGARPTARWRYTPWIVEDAKARRGGFDGWRHTGQAAPAGSLVLFDFNGGGVDHVGLLVEDYKPGKGQAVKTIDGNTGGTNPADGGMVAHATRPTRQVTGFALVDYRP